MNQNSEMNRLFEAARDVAARAHAPYSKFRVGAALLTSEGNIFAGCNIENQSYPEGWCAETSAISHMVVAGKGSFIEQVAVYSPEKAEITPCGGCRQRLAEFGNAQTQVHLCSDDGVTTSTTLGALLPNAFELDH